MTERDSYQHPPLFDPELRTFLNEYRTWPAWKRWAWRRGWIG